MRSYKEKFQRLFMTLDRKPWGKWKQALKGSVRMQDKEELRQELENHDKNCHDTAIK